MQEKKEEKYCIQLECTKILYKENNFFKRRNLEKIFILKDRDRGLNTKSEIEIVGKIYTNFLNSFNFIR